MISQCQVGGPPDLSDPFRGKLNQQNRKVRGENSNNYDLWFMDVYGCLWMSMVYLPTDNGVYEPTYTWEPAHCANGNSIEVADFVFFPE